MQPRLRSLLLSLVCCLFPARSQAGDPYTSTRYPLVLVHGMLGFDEVGGAVGYWYGIVAALQTGGAEVHVLQLSPLNSDELRGEQVVEQIETLLALSGKGKVNLIGHSQGGQAARYAAAVRPDLVASVTTVASPTGGAELADYLAAQPSDSRLFVWLRQAVTALGDLVETLSFSTLPNDAMAVLRSMSSAGAAAFNARFPHGVPRRACGEGEAEHAGQRYFSWSGVGGRTSRLDPLDAILAVTALVYREPNDGLVGRCSSHFGHVLRDDYRQNHADAINQSFGLVAPDEAHPPTLYRVHANRLKRLGL
jgi:triacylglycerol lipase